MSIKERIFNYYSAHKTRFFILCFILLVGAVLRLYKIDQYMTFLGDEGRDVIVVRRLLVEFDPILVGPGTSIGNMYLGPLYYYMMAPALLLANLSPVGPAVMIALLGIFTIGFVWYLAEKWFGMVAAVIAASLYSVSTVVIRYSQSSWNPNIMPFFALLTIYSIWRFWQENDWKWIIVTGISMAFVLQSHYLGLMLVPVAGLFWLIVLVTQKVENNATRDFVASSLKSLGIFIFLMSPLVIFDARHGWRNFEAMKIFFTQRQTTISARPWTAIPDLLDILQQILTTILGAGNEIVGKYLAYLLILLFLIFLYGVFGRIKSVLKENKSISEKFLLVFNYKEYSAEMLLYAVALVALFGFGVYKQHIYAHYFGFLFPIPPLLIGGFADRYWGRINILGKSTILIIVIYLVIINLSDTPIRYSPNRQLQRTVEVAEKILQESDGQPYNLAVIAERNYEGAYQYFLEKENSPLLIIDPQRADETIAKQLFVVCELPQDKCDPVNNEKSEIANFGWSKIDQRWNVAGTTLYKLVPAQ